MKLPTIIQDELDLHPGRWALEMGARHIQIRIDGKLVGIVKRTKDEREQRASLNVRAQIRRAIAGRKA